MPLHSQSHTAQTVFKLFPDTFEGYTVCLFINTRISLLAQNDCNQVDFDYTSHYMWLFMRVVW